MNQSLTVAQEYSNRDNEAKVGGGIGKNGRSRHGDETRGSGISGLGRDLFQSGLSKCLLLEVLGIVAGLAQRLCCFPGLF